MTWYSTIPCPNATTNSPWASHIKIHFLRFFSLAPSLFLPCQLCMHPLCWLIYNLIGAQCRSILLFSRLVGYSSPLCYTFRRSPSILSVPFRSLQFIWYVRSLLSEGIPNPYRRDKHSFSAQNLLISQKFTTFAPQSEQSVCRHILLTALAIIRIQKSVGNCFELNG